MQTFRILYFRDSLLEQADEVQVRDVVEAVEKASGKAPNLRVEVWSNKGRVAEIGTAPIGETRAIAKRLDQGCR